MGSGNGRERARSRAVSVWRHARGRSAAGIFRLARIRSTRCWPRRKVSAASSAVVPAKAGTHNHRLALRHTARAAVCSKTAACGYGSRVALRLPGTTSERADGEPESGRRRGFSFSRHRCVPDILDAVWRCVGQVGGEAVTGLCLVGRRRITPPPSLGELRRTSRFNPRYQTT
jgi:hypothetical protein